MGKQVTTIPISVQSEISLSVILESHRNVLSDSKMQDSSEDEINDKIMDFSTETIGRIKKKKENSYFILKKLKETNIIPYDDNDSQKPDENNEVPEVFINNGYWDYGRKNSNDNDSKLFEQERTMPVNKETFIDLMDYQNDKRDKRAVMRSYYNQLIGTQGYITDVWKKILEQRLLSKANIDLNNINKEPKRMGDFKPLNKSESEPIFELSSCINEVSIDLDPDHQRILETKGLLSLRKYLSRLRDYHEARFRARIALAISINRKPDKCFRVNHWKYRNIYAVVKIKGLILSKDKGVAYISYFHDNELIRTDKWRLPDIENYSVAHHRIVSVLSGMNMSVERSLMLNEVIIISRIIVENSWGLSKFLKAFRYFSSGLVMKSTKVIQSINKMKEEISESVLSKGSTLLIMQILRMKSKKRTIRKGLTPLFDLDFKNLGYESFLVNLCPSNTYGKFRHLQSTISELADEIDLYNKNFSLVQAIFDDFNQCIRSTDINLLRINLEDHIRLVRELCSKTDDRFSFSPISILSLYNQIQSTNIPMKHFQDSLEPLTKLMTAKSSTFSETGEPTIAIKSIGDVSVKYKSLSTSELSIKIICKQGVIDLTMRVFDKDQIGGDREISILSGEFRILQYVCEKFFEKWARLTGIDKLHDPYKTEDLITNFEEHSKNFNRVMLTADQTRWGPNFNTITFGLMALSISNKTTEAFIPAIICLLSEFKIFEMPFWIPSLLDRSDYSYSLPGKLARSHMGQGIFHQSSSLYHSYVIKSYLRFLEEFYDETNHEYQDLTRIKTDALITSDDVAIFFSMENLKSIDMREEIKELSYVKDNVKHAMSFIGDYLKLYGIKTSSYKNIVSEEMIEFNSIHLKDFIIGSTDIKFLYSLIDPSTTGNFLNDFNNVFNLYIAARNSLCSNKSSEIIVLLSFIKFCRQWKLDASLFQLPSRDMMIQGLPIILDKHPDKDLNDMRYLFTKSSLRFKLRKELTYTEISKDPFINTIYKIALDKMKGTRERTAYRSILTHSKSNLITIKSDFFLTSETIGETHSCFMREIMKDTDHLHYILEKELQTTFSVTEEECRSRKGMFKVCILRDPIKVETDVLSLLVSHYDRQEYMELDVNKLYLHLLRNHKRIFLIDKFIDTENGIQEALIQAEELINQIEIKSTACKVIETTGDYEAITYQRYIYIQPYAGRFSNRTISVTFSPDMQNLLCTTSYIPYGTQYIGMLINSDYKVHQKTNPIGHRIKKFIEMEVEYTDIDLDELSLYKMKRVMESEIGYRNSRGDKVFLNISIGKSKISKLKLKEEEKEESIAASKMSNIDDDFDKMMDDIDLFSKELSMLDDQCDKIDIKSDDIEDDIKIDLGMFDLEKDSKEEICIFSCLIDQEYGIYCHKTWILEKIITEIIINKMINDMVIRSDELFDIFSDTQTRFYTIDKNLVNKINYLSASSKSSLRNSQIELSEKEIKAMITKLIKKELSDYQLLMLLRWNVAYINFSTEPKGKLLDKNSFINIFS